MKTYKVKSILNVAVWLTFIVPNLSPGVASECIVSGETKFATIEFGGETHAYYFWAEAGQGVVIEMGDLSSAPGIVEIVNGLEPRVELYDPNGCCVDEAGSDGKCYSRARIENYQLKMTGIYTIVASDADGYYYSGNYYTGYLYESTPDTGEYGLSLVVTGSTTTSFKDVDGGDMTIGRSQRGIISLGGDIDAYTFYGQVGQGVSIEMTDMSSTLGKVPIVNGLELRVELYDPNGFRVAEAGSDGKCYSRARIENYQLKMTGTYTIVTSDADGYYYSGNYYTGYLYESTPDTGEYGLSVSVIPPIDPHGLYPYGPQPADGQTIEYCDPNYQFTDIVVENMILPDGTIVTRRSGAYLLSWWSVIDATGYDVYIASDSCMPLEMVAENVLDPWLPVPVVEGGHCSWRVIAHTPDGDIQGPTWWFTVELYPYSLAISAIGQGSIVDPNEGFQEYSSGEVVSVTAMADTNFEFVRWEGTAVDANKIVVEYQDYRESTIQVTVDGAYTLIAVFEEIIYDFPLDNDPGWIMEGQWEYGIPMGQGGLEHGNPDPPSGYTGYHVIGINLNGDYDVEIGGPYSVVAGPFDLRGYSSVHLRFWSWLNTDMADYVKNSLEMSLDGKTWLLVLHNPEREDVISSEWSRWECGIGSWADSQPEVYMRWSHQILTERAYPYSGWNLDDIQLIGRK